MSFQHIMGQDVAKKMLQSALRNHTVNHAYVFSGPPGSGQMNMAQIFAKALFCERQTDDACGECLSCRKVEHGNHPDLHIVEPDGATIKIDQIRGLQRIFSYKSESSNPKVYIIRQADTMTVQAANSLLKFLEEPQIPVVGILISENGQALLPTIQSRTQQIPFHALQPEVMMQALIGEGYTAGLVRSVVHIASGLESCREILQQNWFAEIRNVVLQLVKESMSRGARLLFWLNRRFLKLDFLNTWIFCFICFICGLRICFISVTEGTKALFS